MTISTASLTQQNYAARYTELKENARKLVQDFHHGGSPIADEWITDPRIFESDFRKGFEHIRLQDNAEDDQNPAPGVIETSTRRGQDVSTTTITFRGDAQSGEIHRVIEGVVASGPFLMEGYLVTTPERATSSHIEIQNGQIELSTSTSVRSQGKARQGLTANTIVNF